MMVIFLEKFLDTDNASVPPSRLDRSWLYGAIERRSSSPVLNSAFEANATAHFGISISDARLVRAAQKMYLNVLHGLQQAIWSPSESRSSETLFAIILACKFEVREPCNSV
jgi:hypothetical protein